MFQRLLLIFIGIPVIEMMILIKLGEIYGFWGTFMLVIFTGFLGAFLAQLEGLRAWLNIQQAMAAGDIPGEQMIDALLIFVAGIVLITPGLLTDVAGFLLLIPQTRFWFKRWLRKKFDEMLKRSRETGSGSDFRFFIQ